MRLFGSALALAALAAAQSSSSQTPTSTPAVSTSTAKEPCARASDAWDKNKNGNIPAELAYDCLTSIPVAVEQDAALIDQLKLLWEWHSEVVYLKNPPQSWQRGPLDLMAELDGIKENLASFDSEYDVQLAIQELTIRTGNFHFNYRPDILSVFTFMRQHASLATVSDDGKSIPKTYLANDMMLKSIDDGIDVSPVDMINGKPAQDYLLDVALHEQYIDRDAAYNSLMHKGYVDSDSEYGNGCFSVPMASAFYWGPTTNLTFANGTERSFENIAFVKDMEGVTDAKTFFNRFCTGKMSGVKGTLSQAAKEAAPGQLSKRQSIVDKFYPKPVVEHSAGAVAGYFLADEAVSDVAVLKIITFAPDPDTNKKENEFQSVVKQFLRRCKDAGMRRLVIDLRENGGGSTQLLLDTFMQLFPTDIPWSIQRNRAQDAFKRIGDAWNAIYNNDALYDKYLKVVGGKCKPNTQRVAMTTDMCPEEEPDLSFWYYDDFLNVEGEQFSTWEQFYGPRTINGDQFTTPMRYNVSSASIGPGEKTD